MKSRKGQALFFIISFLLGFLITVLIYHNRSGVTNPPSIVVIRELMEKEKQEEDQKQIYRTRIAELEKRIEQFHNQASTVDDSVKSIQEELKKAKVLAGLTDLQGPGVEIVLNDRKKETLPVLGEDEDINWYLVHDEDVLRVVNELSAAGAEAISINDTRVVSNTRIRCGGPTINVKDRTLAPPFVIRAIGDPDTMLSSITSPLSDPGSSMSIYNELTSYGIEFTIQKKDSIRIPRYYGIFRFSYARPVQESEGE